MTKAETLKKGFSYNSVSTYIEHYYDLDNYVFDFETQDNIETRSNIGDYRESHCPHVMSHIFECDKEAFEWAKKKLNAAFDEKRGIKTTIEGSFHPTWFISTEDTSNFIEAFLLNDRNASIIEKWCNDRDIYYHDRRNNRLIMNMNFKDIVGYGIVSGTNYEQRFEAHGLHVVIEYTISKNDGEFVIYDAYPIFTESDWDTINKARAAWRKK